MDNLSVVNSHFDPAAEISRLSQANQSMGAVVSFIGTMRDLNLDRSVSRMMLEHYPGMTEKALKSIVERARQQWPLGDVSVIHRVGEIRPADAIVLVAVTSQHRGAAFDACEFIIDYLKTEAPFWKKEFTAEGEHWVEERQSDHETAGKWQTVQD